MRTFVYPMTPSSNNLVPLGRTRIAAISFAVALFVWLLYAWPLALHLHEAIPSSAHNIEIGQMREMIPGDHLQLLYHFWLLSDMLRGETPFFYNLYEFNAGDDLARYYPSPYFVPFSLVYSLFSLAGNRALAWNLAGFVSIWVTLAFTWRLARRFVNDEAAALCASLISVTFTFRWVKLLGGSPAGYAMALVPLVLIGMHSAIRNRSLAGGIVVGVGLMFTLWTDILTFYFLFLYLPVWCLICAVVSESWIWRDLRTWLRAIPPLLPVPVFVGFALALRRHFERQLEGRLLETGRELREVAGYSPHWSGLFQWEKLGVDNHIFIGFVVAFLLGCGAFAVLLPGRFCLEKRRARWVLLLLLASVAGTIVLALGTQGPWEGLALRAARRLIPRYTLLRLPARIFVLMPSLLAVTVATLLAALRARLLRAFFRNGALLIAALGLVAEGRLQIEATLCVLREEQAAYKAVAESARREGLPPRAVVVPLWPGDADLAANYLHFASLYRIRLVNGYSPVVSSNYLQNVFRPLESINQGALDEAQIGQLLDWGISHVLVHEDMFPEKVSPFPVQMTLHRFLTHPRLRLDRQEETVWSFRIEQEPAPARSFDGPAPLYLPTRYFEAEHMPVRQGEVIADATAGRGAFVRLSEPDDALVTPPRRVALDPTLAWFLRVRGQGRLHVTGILDDEPFASDPIDVDSQEWSWLAWPLDLPAFGPGSIELRWEQGVVDIDAVYIGSLSWETPREGETIEWPANGFFHAGHSEHLSGSVFLIPRRDPDGEVFYARVPPLPPGDYEARLLSRGGADTNQSIGIWRAVSSAGTWEVPVLGGEQTTLLSVRQEQELPMRLAFRYAREAEVELMGVQFTRLATTGTASRQRMEEDNEETADGSHE